VYLSVDSRYFDSISRTPIYASFNSLIRFSFSSYRYPSAALVSIKKEHHASKLTAVYIFSDSDVKNELGEENRRAGTGAYSSEFRC